MWPGKLVIQTIITEKEMGLVKHVGIGLAIILQPAKNNCGN